MHSFSSARRVSLLMMCLALALGACSSHTKLTKCEANKGAYLSAGMAPPLSLPEGSSDEVGGSALVIPAGNNQPINTKACLERPPAYFGNAGRIAASPEETVADWAQAWADRNSTSVLAMYANQFHVDGTDSKVWLTQRTTDIASGALPDSRVRQLKMTTTGNDERIATFVQTFGNSLVSKQLTLIREAGVWKIINERVLSTTAKKS